MKNVIENFNTLTEINIMAFHELYKLSKKFSDHQIKTKSNLIIPKYRDNKARYSEQELRQCWIYFLSSFPNLSYSIEAPTMKTYQNTGENARSGNTDLTIYFDNEKYNIELKNGTPDEKSVEIDMKKLCDENVYGYYSHMIAPNENPKLDLLMNKFVKAFNNNCPQKPLIFSFGFLKTGQLLYSKMINISELKNPQNIFQQSFLNGTNTSNDFWNIYKVPE